MVVLFFTIAAFRGRASPASLASGLRVLLARTAARAAAVLLLAAALLLALASAAVPSAGRRTSLAAGSPRLCGFFRGPLMAAPTFVGRPSTFAGDFSLTLRVHSREATPSRAVVVLTALVGFILAASGRSVCPASLAAGFGVLFPGAAASAAAALLASAVIVTLASAAASAGRHPCFTTATASLRRLLGVPLMAAPTFVGRPSSLARDLALPFGVHSGEAAPACASSASVFSGRATVHLCSLRVPTCIVPVSACVMTGSLTMVMRSRLMVEGRVFVMYPRAA